MKERRPYAMKARAAKAASTRARILRATTDLHFDRTYDDLTLEDVARHAGTTVRTVLRLFGSKEELLVAALDASRTRGHGPVEPGDLDAAIQALFYDYEKIGDSVILRLADEHRVPALRPIMDAGRTAHRHWLETAFALELARVAGRERALLRNALLVATDVYVWKLLRRDMKLARSAAEAIVRRIVTAIVTGY